MPMTAPWLRRLLIRLGRDGSCRVISVRVRAPAATRLERHLVSLLPERLRGHNTLVGHEGTA